MCDYSLHAVKSRPAVAGDELVVSGFIGTNSQGLQPVKAEEGGEVAVCLLPGTEVAFEEKPTWILQDRDRTASSATAIFCKLDIIPNEKRIPSGFYLDAFEFLDGTRVLIQHMHRGQRAKVLQLPASEVPAVQKTGEVELEREPALIEV